MIELVIFDCDGVIADSEVISAEVLVAELAAQGIAVTKRHVFRHYVGQSFPKVAAKIRATFRADLPDTFAATYRARLLEAFATRLRPTPGIETVLAGLRPRACVATSSSPPRVARTLELCGLTDRFGADVFTASEVARGKPAPDLFLHAARRMGVAPGNCLVIEDSKAGILAAKAAGMTVWRYTGGAHMQGFSAAELDMPEDVTVFDTWGRFFLLAPDLKR